ncbi:MAG: chemotaxis protein CheA [Lachnospiraceae bacterium]|nr:chemotaxis protein CheA [Lachnospiraceae bacterium]
MDVSQYLEIFIDETKEHLQNLNTQILDLEQSPDDMDTVNEIFRAAHSLKGMAGTMGYKRMQTLTHDMENVFSKVRDGALKVNSSIIDTIFQCLDALEEYLDNIQSSADEGTNDNENIIKALNGFLNGESAEPKAEEKKTEPQAPNTENAETPVMSADGNPDDKWKSIKFSEEQLHVMGTAKGKGLNVVGVTVFVQESCILKAARAFLVFKTLEELGEVIISVPSAQDIEDERFELDFSMIIITEKTVDDVIKACKGVSEIAKVSGGAVDVPAIAEEEKESETELQVSENKAPQADNGGNTKAPAEKKPVVNRTVRVDIEKLDVLMNLVSELIIAKNSLVSAATSTGSATNEINEHIEYLENVTTNLHESVMKVRMVPIESVVNKFPRMIRDLQKKLGKKMELYMSGEETELDRTVVDEIGDPIMHLLRNSADHGIESDVNLRIQRGKPEAGSIYLDAYQDGNNVVIEVKDDGNGIDVNAVRNKAIERGTITSEQADSMTDQEIINLLFLPSFSTAKVVSDISGRGVGLDVVKSKIESLSGEVEVKSTLGVGSTWTIRLPLTLAIIQTLMVIVGGEKYAIPLSNIQTIESIRPDEVSTVQTKEVITLRGNIIPLIRLNEVLGCESTKDPNEELVVVIVKKGDKMAGLVIDTLTGQQEIVIKSLGKYINKSKLISGATILGNGEVALIIDPNALI